MIAFAVATVIFCVLDLIMLYVSRRHQSLHEVDSGDLAVALLLIWAWSAWGVWLVFHETTSLAFTVCSVVVLIVALTSFIEGLKKSWMPYAAFGAWRVVYAVAAVAAAGVSW